MKRVVPEVHVFITGQLPIDKFNISFAPGFVRKCIARVTEEARQVVVMPLAFFVGLSGFSFGPWISWAPKYAIGASEIRDFVCISL